jgi:NitT/TauT family transport system permease protein
MKITYLKTNLIFALFIAAELLWHNRIEGGGFALMIFLGAAQIIFWLRLIRPGDEVKKRALSDLLFIFYLLVFIWNIFTAKLDIWDSFLFPAPGVVVFLFISEIPKLLSALLSSAVLLGIGYCLALAIGIPLALIVGWYKRLYFIASPLAKILGPIPPIVYVPYAIAVLPTFRASSIFIVFIGAFWPIFINTLNGVFAIDKGILDSARAIHVRETDMIFRVILPGCVPQILSGATIGLSFSLILLTSAEMIGSTNGMGWYVKYFSEFANYPKVIVGILFIGIVVSVITYFAEKLEKHLLRWRKQ